MLFMCAPASFTFNEPDLIHILTSLATALYNNNVRIKLVKEKHCTAFELIARYGTFYTAHWCYFVLRMNGFKWNI